MNKTIFTGLLLLLCACPRKHLPSAPPCQCPNSPPATSRPDAEFDVALDNFETMISVTHDSTLSFFLEGSEEKYDYEIFPMPELLQDGTDDTILRLAYPDSERTDAFAKLEVSGEPPRYLVKACVDEYAGTCKAYVTIKGKKPIRLHVDMNDKAFEWEPESAP